MPEFILLPIAAFIIAGMFVYILRLLNDRAFYRDRLDRSPHISPLVLEGLIKAIKKDKKRKLATYADYLEGLLRGWKCR